MFTLSIHAEVVRCLQLKPKQTKKSWNQSWFHSYNQPDGGLCPGPNRTWTVSFQILPSERFEECDVEHLESEPALQWGPCSSWGRVGGRIETWFSRDGMYTPQQVRKTTLFHYLAEQPTREREEQGENGGERVLHSKWPLKSLTKKNPLIALLWSGEFTKAVCYVEPSHYATDLAELLIIEHIYCAIEKRLFIFIHSNR